CPLKGALLMQVHDRPQGAPVLALAGDSVSVNACKAMHLMNAWLLYVKMEEFSGIFNRTTARPVQHDGGCNSGSVRA
ncbi:hypothetical protein MBN62_004712, partial [Klebsiella pneumoniae]